MHEVVDLFFVSIDRGKYCLDEKSRQNSIIKMVNKKIEMLPAEKKKDFVSHIEAATQIMLENINPFEFGIDVIANEEKRKQKTEVDR